MGKIPKNLSDKDMFKGWKEEPTIEETMLKAAEPKQAPRSQAKRAPEKREGSYQTYLSQDAVDTMEKLLLEIKLDLYRQGVSDYHINVRRDGNKIILEHQTVEKTLKN